MKHTIQFTIDIEDWFTDGRQIRIDSWSQYELTIESNVHALLALLSKHNAKATFFVLGWIARKRPALIKEVYANGHEIASHSYAHELVYTLSQEKFRKDVRMSKHLLEDIIRAEVIGYRAPCFSITPWAFDILREEGFVYDSIAGRWNIRMPAQALSLSVKQTPIQSGWRIKHSTSSPAGLPCNIYRFRLPFRRCIAC